MHNKADKEFDSYIKSILEDAQEQAPAGIWDAIESRLPQPRRSPAFWWRTAGMGLAAAALALGAFFIIRPSGSGSAPAVNAASSNYVAVVPLDNVDGESNATALLEPVKEPAIARRSSNAPQALVIEADIPETETDTAAGNPVPSAAESESSSQAQSSEPEEFIEYTINPFASTQEPSVKGGKVEVQFNGLVGSNEPGQTAFHGRPLIMGAPSANSMPAQISETTESEYDIPLSFGAGVRFYFDDRLSLGTGVNFTMLSRSFDGTFKGAPASSIKHSVQYIGIPVNLYCDLFGSDFIKVYSFAGGTAEKAISNSFFINSAGENITYSEKVNGLQLSASLGLGVQFNLSNTIGLYLDPSARYYFDCDQPKSIRTKQPFMFGFEAGLRFNLK